MISFKFERNFFHKVISPHVLCGMRLNLRRSWCHHIQPSSPSPSNQFINETKKKLSYDGNYFQYLPNSNWRRYVSIDFINWPLPKKATNCFGDLHLFALQLSLIIFELFCNERSLPKNASWYKIVEIFRMPFKTVVNLALEKTRISLKCLIYDFRALSIHIWLISINVGEFFSSLSIFV